jgi:hypothetical protein
VPLRNTVLVGAIFVLLGAYIYFFELPKGDKEKYQPLLSFKQEDVAGMTLAYPGQEIQLRKETSGRWRMTHPLQVPADESTISGVLSALSAIEVKRTIEEKAGSEELKNFGLDKPQVKISISLKGGGSLPPVLIGAKTPVGDSTYVKKETEPRVLLTSSLLSSSFEKKLHDFRDKKILDISENEVKQLTLKRAAGTLVLVRKGDEWFIDKPKPYRADQAEVQGILASLSTMFARDFVDNSRLDLKRYGLDRPFLQIGLDTAEKGQREILFGDRRQGNDEIYVTMHPEGTVYRVLESVLKSFDKDLTALRDKQVLSFAQDKVAKLQIDRAPDESIVLVKTSDGEWAQGASKTEKPQQQAVMAYLAALGTLRANGFAEDEPKEIKKYGLEPPAVRISLDDKDGKSLGTLLVGRSPNGYFAKRGSGPTVYDIDELSYKQIDKHQENFLAKKAEAPPSNAPKK